ncbi:pulvinus outward-rectifying channel for potassium SPOCK1 family protein [Salix suchowensis]|nr:pulvinus outward-rectifying channel for potassium SPOCK1 family protein [Salix suchowensis]
MAINDDAMQSLLSDEENAFQRRRFRQPMNADNQNFSFKKVFVVLAIYLGAGTLCFTLIMNQIEGKKTNGILDAVYFSVVTMTTVGYGDLVPHTTLAKLLSCVYVFTGMALGGIIISKAADYIVEKQEILLVRAMHVNEKIGSSEILKEAETHKVKYKCLLALILLFLLIIVGTIFLHLVESFEFVDAFYCVCSVEFYGIKTAADNEVQGYDSFSTRAGRIFAVFWILSSTICLAQFFLYSAELYTEKRQRLLVERVLARNVTASYLEEADIDHDKTVSAAEFIVYTLKEMGKISQEDISLVMERFSKLDVDQSGTLTESDIISS